LEDAVANHWFDSGISVWDEKLFIGVYHFWFQFYSYFASYLEEEFLFTCGGIYFSFFIF
jgi:hypothetical protein